LEVYNMQDTRSMILAALFAALTALGFAALEARADGLYAVDVELLPLAAILRRSVGVEVFCD
jgi:hypothetical protein